MHWLTHAYSITAVACGTLALVHLLVWAKQPAARAHLAFFLTASSVAAITPFEWLMARAQTTDQFGSTLRWIQVPISFAIVSLVWFLWLYLGTGRRWLALAACIARVLAMVLGFLLTPNLNFRKITELRQVALGGGESASAPIGVVSPWTLVGQLSSLLLLAFVVDASVRLWRKGDRDSRRRAALIGGAAAFFIIGSAGYSALILAGVIVSPVFIGLPFLPVVLAMGYELSMDVVRAGQLSREVKANEERLALAQEAGDVGTFDWDLRTGRVMWNEKLESMHGLPRGGFGGAFDNWLELVHPEDRPRCDAEIDVAIKQKHPSWQAECRIFRADNNEMRWIDARARLFFDPNGEPVRMLGVNVDITARKLAEEAARKGEERNRDLLRALPDIIFLLTPDGVFLDYYAKDPSDLYAPPTEFLGKNIKDTLPKELADDFIRCFERATENGEPQVMEYELSTQDEERWFEARMIRSQHNQILTVVRDVTDRKLAEAALSDSEARLSGLVSSAMDAIISIDESQRIILLNAAAEQMFGCSADDMMGQPVSVLIPERFRRAHEEYVRAFGETKTKRVGLSEPICGRRSDGTEFPIEASISQVEMHGHHYYTVIMRDVTERKRAEEALQASETRFRNMADTAPVLIWISGPDRLCIYFNQGWLDFTGRSLEQELGNGWFEGIHPDDFARCLNTFNQAFDRREAFKMEYRLRRANGEYRWIYDCGTPRFSAEGEFLGYIGSCIDISDRKEAEAALQKAHEEVSELKNQLQAENIILQEEIKLAHKVNEIIGDSDALKYVLFKVEQVAQTDSSVLILGETGTGKELVARAIHEQSRRKDRPLIKVNCAALSASLIESELFGHEKGAFTGAWARKIGRFELANGGTIFLDEIGELPLELQSKLLRVIQEGEFERLGSSKTIKVDVRIIAATNRNMTAAIEKGTFREDLWYRLNVFPITVPPLRQRKEDIPALVEHFVKGLSISLGKPITSISSATLKKFQDYSWPGNIRELANVIERGVINAQGQVLHIVDQFEPSVAEGPGLSKTLEDVEKEYILRVLDETSWRIEGPYGAARILGLHPSTLRTRMTKLGVMRGLHTAAARK